MDWAAGASAVAAGLSVVGAGLAWWLANKSKAARLAAELAEERAAAHLAASEVQARSATETLAQVERIAASLEGPQLVVVSAGESRFGLVNRRDVEVTVVEVLNRDDFVRIDGLEDGVTIPPSAQKRFQVLEGWHASSENLYLLLGDGQRVYVPLG